MVDKKDFLLKESHARTERMMTIPAKKSMILDRNGEKLAVSHPYYRLAINPKIFDRSKESIHHLSVLSGADEKLVINKLQRGKNRSFVVILNRLDHKRAQAITRKNIKGVLLEEKKGRFYPLGEKASSIIGYLDSEGVGRLGLEKQFESYFNTQDGRMLYTQNLLGQVTSVNFFQAPQSNDDLTLTMDHRIQTAAWSALKDCVEYHQADHASAVVLDVKSGEILAIADYPSFDPNRPISTLDEKTRTRAVSDLFEPGSIIKPIALTAVLQHHHYDPKMIIDTEGGQMHFEDVVIHDHKNLGHISFEDILLKSSNIAMVKLATSLPEGYLLRQYERFGLLTPLFVQIPGEISGKHIAKPTLVDEGVMSYGYGVSTSVLAMARAYNVIANLGKDPGVNIVTTKHRITPESLITEKQAKQITDMMVKVTQMGVSSRLASIKGIDVAGKSGTTKLLNSEGLYQKEYISSFAGFAPAYCPKVVVVVIVDKPKKHGYYGGKVAGPLFAKIMRHALHYHPDFE